MQAAVGWASWDILSSDPVTSLEKLASLPLIYLHCGGSGSHHKFTREKFWRQLPLLIGHDKNGPKQWTLWMFHKYDESASMGKALAVGRQWEWWLRAHAQTELGLNCVSTPQRTNDASWASYLIFVGSCFFLIHNRYNRYLTVITGITATCFIGLL